MSLSCDLFCRVVDNFGDAAVCWRLAVRLAANHGWRVRLWIDDLRPLAALRPGILTDCAQQSADGVDVRQWPPSLPQVVPGDVVIEAFACNLPDAFIEAMARLPRPPVWLNLEYLSAEEWVDGCHGLTSPHPRLPLVKHFFFPGFTRATGGLLGAPAIPAAPRPTDQPLRISLFCYANAALPGLLSAWAAGSDALHVLVTDGMARRQVEEWLGVPFAAGKCVERKRLRLEALPFLPQTEYGALLGDCDLNFVRGEDSFVAAQWAQRPLVWQIYPQSGDAQWEKLDAFLRRYCAHLPEPVGRAVADFSRAWNGHGDPAATWEAFRPSLPLLQSHAVGWAAEIAKAGDLAENLVKFCTDRI